MRRIYLDANATTPLTSEVVEAMRPFWSETFGNASAVHSFGRTTRSAIDEARDHIATLINAKANEITFTSGGTESDNTALFGLLAPGDHLLISSIEHDAILHAADALEARGVEVTRLPCDGNGIVQFEKADLKPNTKLVSVMLANNETGVLQPIQSIAEITHAHGALLHTDAVQAVGKIPVNVRELQCDLLSISGHKMHAPQGTGALWQRSGLTIRPLLYGGSHERNRRAGTENVAGIVALGKAAGLSHQWLAGRGSQSLTVLRDHFEQALLQNIPDLTINGAEAERLPNTTSIVFHGVNAEELVIALDLQGLAASGGSACQSGAIEPSHVLRAMSLPEAAARSSVRFSLSRLTTPEEIESAIAIITRAVQRLRSVGTS